MRESQVDSIFDEWTDVIDNAREPEVVEGPQKPEVVYRPEELEPLVMATFNALCRSFDVQEIEQRDARDISVAAAPVVTKYLGSSWEKWAAEIALFGVMLKLGMPRIQEYAEKRQLQAAEQDVTLDEVVSEGEY